MGAKRYVRLTRSLSTIYRTVLFGGQSTFKQFGGPSASVPSTAIPASAQWPATTDPPTEAEILRETKTLRRHKAPGSDGLSPDLFINGGMEVVREVLV